LKPFVLISAFGTTFTAVLLYLFPQIGLSTIYSLLTGMIVSMGFGVLAIISKKNASYFFTITILIFLQIYVLIWIFPTDRFGASADEEFRTALQATIKYDDLQESMILQQVNPPYSRFTAAAHRFKDELPQYSWSIAFSNPHETNHQSYLLNIRNDIAGYAYPNITDAQLNDDSLVLQVSHEQKKMRYEIPIRNSIDTITITGRDQSGQLDSDYVLEVHPHYLKPFSGMRFQALYWHILDWIK